jgi:U3 small nucleolar RNA-associated protein 4
LLSVVDDTLTHLRRFDRIKTRILSLSWGPPIPQKRPMPQDLGARSDSEDDEDEQQWTDSWLVTGGSDSSIRTWNVATGRAMERMGTEKVKGERTLVWAVAVLG